MDKLRNIGLKLANIGTCIGIGTLLQVRILLLYCTQTGCGIHKAG